MEFLRSNDTVDVLAKASLVYYQFETIHLRAEMDVWAGY